jgi:integrase
MAEGIVQRHSRSCPKYTDKNAPQRCRCTKTYAAWVYDKSTGKKIKKTFPTEAAARTWRADWKRKLDRGQKAPTKVTLNHAAAKWLADAEAGIARNKSGERYKPSALRSYRHALDKYILPDLGAFKLSEVRRADVQALIDRLNGQGFGGSTIANTVMPLRVIYRRALESDDVEVNPTTNLRLPAASGPRERAASPAEAAALVAALPENEQALWATAFYAGLRRGELRALRVSDVDLAKGVINVTRSWDDTEGAVGPKSKKGKRTVPIVGLLRDHLDAHIARTGRGGDDFIFGITSRRPFSTSHVRRRALGAWAAAAIGSFFRIRRPAVLLEPIVLHECRHTCVSIWHDAGLSLERIGDYIGHSSAYMTDRYRHLLDGHHAEAAAMVDAYLQRADTQARLAQVAE